MKRTMIMAAVAALAACTGQVGEAPDVVVSGQDVLSPDGTSDVLVGADAAPEIGVDAGPDGGAETQDDILQPLGPLVPTIDPTLEFGRTAVLNVPTEIAADLGDGRLLAASADEVWLIDGDATTMLGAPPAEVLGAVALGDATLVATESVLAVEDDGELVESPLHEAIGASAIPWMFRTGGNAEGLWLVTTNALWRWSDGWLTELDPVGLGATTLAASWGGLYDGQPSLWLGGVEEIFAVYADGDDWRATLERTDLTPRTLSSDAAGTLWVLDEANGLHRRTSDGQWRRVDLGADVVELAGHSASDTTWFVRADGVIVQHLQGLWRSAPWSDGSPNALGGGTLIVSAETSTDRMAPLGFVSITGVPSGTLQLPVVATVVVDDPARVAGISADIDGDAVPVSETAPFTLSIDPSTLTEGTHTLSVEVTYNDGADPVSRQLEFAVGAPLSWLNDLEPIWANSCTPCHHPDASSHPLHTAALWRAEIDKILAVVKSGAMPLDPQPKLSPAEIALIEGWMSAGMPD